MGKTTIEWTEHSVNPIRTDLLGPNDRVTGTGHHCDKISPGCKNCYASRLQPRFQLPPYDKRQGVELWHRLDEKVLESVLRRRQPTKYFWCDMTDMFGDWVKDEWLDRIFATMALTPQHTHQVLTKRPERARAYMRQFRRPTKYGWPLPNVWFGASVEDQKRADERIPILLGIPAAKRFVSYEPALEYVDFSEWLVDGDPVESGHLERARQNGDDLEALRLIRHGSPRISWLIIGGESGPGARPFDMEWARKVIGDCKAAGVAAFFKQAGARPITTQDSVKPGVIVPLKDPKGGDWEEWPEEFRVREYPSCR